jgi:T-complex protein 1 subunit delta
MTTAGLDLHCFLVHTNTLEVISYTLAEDVGLKPIKIVTELRKAHAEGNVMAGIDMKVRCISDMYTKNVT